VYPSMIDNNYKILVGLHAFGVRLRYRLFCRIVQACKARRKSAAQKQRGVSSTIKTEKNVYKSRRTWYTMLSIITQSFVCSALSSEYLPLRRRRTLVFVFHRAELRFHSGLINGQSHRVQRGRSAPFRRRNGVGRRRVVLDLVRLFAMQGAFAPHFGMRFFAGHSGRSPYFYILK